MSLKFNDENFTSEVIETSKKKPVLVDFFAEWCGPCKMQAPIIDEVANELGEKAAIGKLNTEEAQSSAAQYNVMSIPTIIIFRDGEVKETLVGMQPKDKLVELIEKYV